MRCGPGWLPPISSCCCPAALAVQAQKLSVKETEPFTIMLAPLLANLMLAQASSLQERISCRLVPLSNEHILFPPLHARTLLADTSHCDPMRAAAISHPELGGMLWVVGSSAS